jgi:tetratricopeptide (TPR) repeat protein
LKSHRDTTKKCLGVLPCLFFLLIAERAFSQVSPRVSEIESLIARERFEEARERLKTFKVGPGDKEGLNLIGQTWIKKTKFDEAIETYETILELDPTDLNAYFWLGTLHRWKGEIAPSLEAYSHAINRNPKLFGALTGRARIWLLKKDDMRAERDLMEAYKLEPKSKEVHELLAEVYFNRRDYGRAESSLKNVYAGAELRKALGDLYRGRGKRNNAMREYKNALALAPDDPEVHRSLGHLYREKGNLRRSTYHFKKVVGKLPADADAHFWLGLLYRWRGMLQEAEREFRETLKIDPRHSGAMIGLARVLSFYGRTEEALGLTRQAVSVDPRSSEARSVLGAALESKELFQDSRNAFAEGVRLGPKDEEAWRGMWRTESLVKPSLGGNFFHYDARVIEGREKVPIVPGLPAPSPVKTRYHGYRFTEEGRYPISPSFTFSILSEQFRDAVEFRSGPTIYDVGGYSVRGVGEYRISPRLKLGAGVGEAWFKNNFRSGLLNQDQVFIPNAEITYAERESRFLTRFGYQRGYVLGRRSVTGATDFAVFFEDRVFGHLEKRWGDNWDWKGDLWYSNYSDNQQRVSAFTTLDFSRDIHVLTLYGRVFPLQGRFLRGDDRLKLIDSGSAGGFYRLRVLPPVELFGEYRYQHYSDSNSEHFGRVGLAYTVPSFKPLSTGVEYSVDDFRTQSRHYSSLDVRAISPFIRLKGTVVPYLDYDLRYAHSFKTDAIESYGSDEVFWNVEYFVNFFLRAGVSGNLRFNNLPERGQDYRFYFKMIF